MLQNPCKTLGFKKKYGLQNSPWVPEGKPIPASDLAVFGLFDELNITGDLKHCLPRMA